NIQKPVQVAIQKLVQKNRDYISQEETDKWVNPNAQKPGEHFRTWGTQLQKRWKELGLDECLKTEDLDGCMTLCHDLEQYDPEAVRPLTKEELKEEHEKKN
ncbi:14712_t:CDS:1, partial [Racocetra persica]